MTIIFASNYFSFTGGPDHQGPPNRTSNRRRVRVLDPRERAEEAIGRLDQSCRSAFHKVFLSRPVNIRNAEIKGFINHG